MSDSDQIELSDRIDALIAEVRRQGRAAVAAQAAAEGCLEATEALRTELEELRADVRDLSERAGELGEEDSALDDACAEKADDLEASAEGSARALALATDEIVRALLPVADSIDRVVSELGREPAAATRWWERVLRRGDTDPRLESLRLGAKLLRASLDQALERMGVRVDRRVGIPVEGEVHRVVGVREAGPGARPGTVASVARPGYSRQGRILREADVIAVEPERRAT